MAASRSSTPTATGSASVRRCPDRRCSVSWPVEPAREDGDGVVGVAQPLVELVRALAAAVAGQLDQPATGLARPRQGLMHQPFADRPADEVRDSVPAELRTPRQTDMGGPTAPFDTRNYRQTAEGLRWLHTLREEHDACVAPRTADEGACCLVEVSPQATTIDLGLPRRRAPSRPGEIRARAAALRTFVTFRTAETEALAVTLEDAWDAVLCALTAWLVRDDLEQPFRTGSRDRETLELEGWIYRPPAALG